ncbi:BQ5605_C049g12433 [Microbotryum silenes-dioicae]|uniref:BQ5605_C049g12433 protein n=1 Tax=Microbotryum silenes-dioicae TaxID=796604 RepID=A0A2X0MSG3_9BASI|nr:BQ5605_C049g12433 [Microbotryum silenes-dioicae]
MASTSSRYLRPARTFSGDSDEHSPAQPPRRHSRERKAPLRRPTPTLAHSRESSNEGDSESSHRGRNEFKSLDRESADAYTRLQRPGSSGFIRAETLPRCSPSTASSMSSIGSSFDLADSPAASLFFSPPPIQQARNVTFDKENVPNRKGMAGPRKLDLELQDRPQETMGVAEPRSANAMLQHVRVKASPTTFGFPFASSILATSDSFADLRGPASRTSVQDHARPSAATQGRSDPSRSDKSASSHRLSSDVDLDLSFDYHQEPEMVFGDEASIESASAEWIGIDMTGRPAEHDVPEGELVRSPSGRLLGTHKKRVRSAVDLRAQFRMAEAVAIPMIEDVPTEEALGTTQGLLIDESTHAPSGIPVGTFGRRVSAPIQIKRPTSWGNGFAFNPTNPLMVTLPDSPGFTPSPSPTLTTESKTLAAPFRFLERARSSIRLASPLSTPVLGRSSVDVKGKGWATPNGNLVGVNESLQQQTEGTTARRKNWASQLAQSAMVKWGSPTTSSHEARSATPTMTKFHSPLPLSVFDHPQHSASFETFNTAETTPIPDVGQFEKQRGARSDVENFAVSEALKPAEDLAGLGIAFNASDNEGRSIRQSLASRQARTQPSSEVVRPYGHRTIPSLSVTRPIEDGHETSSVTSRVSAVDPTASRRNSWHSGQYGDAIQRFSAPSVARRRSLYGNEALHVLVPQTSPHGRMAPQTGPASPRFSFTPAPLQLVKAHCPPPEVDATTGASISVQAPINSSLRHRRPHSVGSLLEATITRPGHFIETTVPSKLLFLAGFLLGPWCWIIGGWWLRPSDGELRRTRGTRCREEGCACGMMVPEDRLRGITQRHLTHSRGLKAHFTSVVGGGTDESIKWMGLDEWVFTNRVLAITSGVAVVVVVAIAMFEASMAA